MVKQKETKWKAPMLPLEWEVEREDDWEERAGAGGGKVEEREELLLSPILNVASLTTRGRYVAYVARKVRLYNRNIIYALILLA